MSELTMQPEAPGSELEYSKRTQWGPVEPPKPEDEGLSPQEIRWIPLVVPLAALTMLLAAAAVLSTA